MLGILLNCIKRQHGVVVDARHIVSKFQPSPSEKQYPLMYERAYGTKMGFWFLERDDWSVDVRRMKGEEVGS
jgi:hypothetical protein